MHMFTATDSHIGLCKTNDSKAISKSLCYACRITVEYIQGGPKNETMLVRSILLQPFKTKIKRISLKCFQSLRE